jgi:hypothetical protein
MIIQIKWDPKEKVLCSIIKLDVPEPVLWIRINFGQLDPDPHYEYGSGCKGGGGGGKMTHNSKGKFKF